MTTRKAKQQDVVEILKIIEEAKEELRKNGVDQWQNGYPNRTVIEDDIAGDVSYVVEKEGKIVGTAMFSLLGEPRYDEICEGEWLTHDHYGVIHRIAVARAYKGEGVADVLLTTFQEIGKAQGIKSIKIDTHKENKRMQRFLQKQGFVYCGVIYLEDGNARVAFEKVLETNKDQ